MKKIDLHLHTINTDGAYTTQQLLKMCEEQNLEIISITDHYNVQAYYDIKKENLSFKGKIIPGVELSFALNGRLFDVLGYGVEIDIINEWVQEKYSHEKIFANQKLVLEEMKALYRKLGIKFDESAEITLGKASEAYNLIKPSALKYEENRIVAPELFDNMFFKVHHTNINSKYYVNETRMTPTLQECLDIIHKAGGISSLAHSGAYGFTKEEMTDFINHAIECGVDGIELKYNCHTEDHECLIRELASKNNLFVTGGSDYHGGKVKPQVKVPGKAYNDKSIYDYEVAKFLNELENKDIKLMVS